MNHRRGSVERQNSRNPALEIPEKEKREEMIEEHGVKYPPRAFQASDAGPPDKSPFQRPVLCDDGQPCNKFLRLVIDPLPCRFDVRPPLEDFEEIPEEYFNAAERCADEEETIWRASLHVC